MQPARSVRPVRSVPRARRVRRRACAVLGAFACVLACVACTSTGDGGAGAVGALMGGGELQPPTSTVPATSSVFLAAAASTRAVFCVDVEVGRVNDLYAVAFQLEYDASLMSFRDATLGPFLGMPAELLFQVDAQETGSAGLLTVGVSRQGMVAGILGCSSGCATERGALVTLCWDLAGTTGTSPLRFAGNRVGYNSNGTGPGDVEIPASGFVGASVQIQ